MNARRAPAWAVTLAASTLALAGCGGETPPTPVPRSITPEQARALPLEEADDLAIRQNLAGERPRGPIGVDPAP